MSDIGGKVENSKSSELEEYEIPVYMRIQRGSTLDEEWSFEWHKMIVASEPSKAYLSNIESVAAIKFPSPGASVNSSVVFLGSRIYVIGGSRGSRHCLTDVVYSDPLLQEGCVNWHLASPMLFPRMCPGVAALDNKIFVFGGGINHSPNDIAEVYDPRTDTWQFLPAPHDDPDSVLCWVSNPVVADPSSGRILVHCTANDSLYSFSINNYSWTCIDPEFGSWSGHPVLVDKLIYLLNGCTLFAYDLDGLKWLDPPNFYKYPLQLADEGTWDTLLYLGGDNFCIAVHAPISGVVYYVTFKVKRVDSLKLFVAPDHLRILKIGSAVRVENYLTLRV